MRQKLEDEAGRNKKEPRRKEKNQCTERATHALDPVKTPPTLIHQQTGKDKKSKELHETIAPENSGSLNERLKESRTELSDSLQGVTIKDLKKAIGINSRYLYINELFRGDEVMYERSINNNRFPFILTMYQRELKLKLGWDDKDSTVKQFDQVD